MPCRLVAQCEKEGLRQLHDDLQIHHQRLQVSIHRCLKKTARLHHGLRMHQQRLQAGQLQLRGTSKAWAQRSSRPGTCMRP